MQKQDTIPMKVTKWKLWRNPILKKGSNFLVINKNEDDRSSKEEHTGTHDTGTTHNELESVEEKEEPDPNTDTDEGEMKKSQMKILITMMTMTKTWMTIIRHLLSFKKTSCAPYKTSQTSQPVRSYYTVSRPYMYSPIRNYRPTSWTRNGHWHCFVMLEMRSWLRKETWRAMEWFGTNLKHSEYSVPMQSIEKVQGYIQQFYEDRIHGPQRRWY